MRQTVQYRSIYRTNATSSDQKSRALVHQSIKACWLKCRASGSQALASKLIHLEAKAGTKYADFGLGIINTAHTPSPSRHRDSGPFKMARKKSKAKQPKGKQTKPPPPVVARRPQRQAAQTQPPPVVAL